MWPLAIVCSRGNNSDLASFCMAVENSPNFCIPAATDLKQNPLHSILNSDSFKL